jgi:hypothetical protein
MKPSEELMLLLELNGFDILKFKLKKQLEYEKTGNIDLYKHKKYADLVVSHYQFEKDADYFHRNPLTYRELWGSEVKSVDQFYFKHPEIDFDMTISEFMKLSRFNEVQKESILYDVFDNWVEEYRDSSITQMENLREMIVLLPKKSKKHRKPSIGSVFFMTIFILLIGFIYKNPEFIKPGFLTFVHDYVDNYNSLLYSVNWYSLLGVFVMLVMSFSVVYTYFLGRFIKDVRSEKNKYALRAFDRWEEDMKNSRLQQSGLLEDYVDRIVKNPKKTFFDIKSLIGPEILMDKFKRYVFMVEFKFDWMAKNYKKLMRWNRRIILIANLLNIVFYVVGFALIRGWI